MHFRMSLGAVVNEGKIHYDCSTFFSEESPNRDQERMLTDLSVRDFLDCTAAREAAPGGGCIAALAGALAAALAEMVSTFTLGRPQFADVAAKIEPAARDAVEVRRRLTDAIDQDAQAHHQVLAAHGLPGDGAAQSEVRRQAIEEAMKKAIQVPLEVAKASVKALDLALVIVHLGNPQLLADSLTAAVMARGAVLAAAYNVEINLAKISDRSFAAQAAEKAAILQHRAEAKERLIRERIYRNKVPGGRQLFVPPLSPPHIARLP